MDDEDAVRRIVARTWERNRPRVLARLARVREALDDCPGGHDLPSELDADLHALVGALGTYGWLEASDVLFQVRASLADASGDAAVRADLVERLQQVEQQMIAGEPPH